MILFLLLSIQICRATDLKDFDLSNLTRELDDPYTFTDNEKVVRFNFRGKVGLRDDITTCGDDDCIFQVIYDTEPPLCDCYGVLSTEEPGFFPDDKGIILNYEYRGEYWNRTAELDFKCSKSEKSPFATLISNNRIIIEWNHPQGCPKSKPDPNPDNPNDPNKKKDSKKKLSFGSIMLIIFSVLLVVYFAAGIPLMHFAFKKSGLEMIPFIGFWKCLPGLVIDGVKFCLSPCIKSKGGYTNVKD
ncbi:putative Autophagy-related protein 27 [Monocercomonoides exilis]|uniref:putative Autophagy-related protein 27 n=1 Tax=Monocercomonoides exilis TaxID=2049356 RepID=UPI00355AAB9A|nr:putative Autophagy-related protein 27 [Monocercomonoides exilis]|eukprot:MONOS_14894.1-p1 / transcript=MONOS_14894.1 / gene=MONOS_14894 / organism=Monocercomonoides_exilis_PA203 / gene_product=unspecified product / transcript_product=unspecified product / location=Mono_scaffold01099:5237-6271(+) / protein_length=243 / sequence_SO=supercontig / SO=protein_coding / is_pseudo=false